MEVGQDDEQDKEMMAAEGADEEDEDEEDVEEPVVVIRDVEYEGEEDPDDEDEEEVLWDPDWDDELKAEAWAAQDRLVAAAAADASTSALQTTG